MGDCTLFTMAGWLLSNGDGRLSIMLPPGVNGETPAKYSQLFLLNILRKENCWLLLRMSKINMIGSSTPNITTVRHDT
jgi:hypothetical protein